MGAWIETHGLLCNRISITVAPLVGAWIETYKVKPMILLLQVAPLVGAWIETWATTVATHRSKSHPSWVRGLKQVTRINKRSSTSRTPRGCVD